jgi:hypothetical protein
MNAKRQGDADQSFAELRDRLFSIASKIRLAASTYIHTPCVRPRIGSSALGDQTDDHQAGVTVLSNVAKPFPTKKPLIVSCTR